MKDAMFSRDSDDVRAEPAPDLRPVEGPEADEDLARLAKALGHPTRVMILRRVRVRDGCTCTELVGELGLAQSTVSEHLRVLREAGLVHATDGEAPRNPYRADVHRLRRLKALVGSL
ncbi:ArsR/SmtB family transcription factor [Sandaracinus amylolyticus]|uniref:ArsR/SmtB family transcription factor n=1 Tax=Sandaracinus amylolyticus TaxID=927083 RepID=UPI001EFF5FEF|nr:metalloregulator ArsR/SmtB family transcription factor [Sandaracinus amylolyticus]